MADESSVQSTPVAAPTPAVAPAPDAAVAPVDTERRAPVVKAPIDFADIVSNIKAQDLSGLKQNAFATQDLDSNREAEVIKLSDKFNVRPDFIRDHYEDFAKVSSAPDHAQLTDIVENNPSLTKMLQDPSNMALMKQDLPALKRVEDNFVDYSWLKNMGNTIEGAGLNVMSNAAKIPAFLGNIAGSLPAVSDTGLTPEEKAYAANKSVTVPDNWWHNSFTNEIDEGSKRFLSQVPEANGNAFKEIAKGNVTKGSRILSLQLAQAAPDLAFMMSTGILGVGMTALGAGAGSTDRAISAGIAPEKAAAAGVAHSVMFASMGAIKLNALGDWANALTEKFGRDISRQVMLDVGKNLTYNSLTLATQQTVAHGVDQFADYVTGINPNAFDNFGDQSANQMLSGGVLGLILHGGEAASLVHASVREAAANRDFMTSLGSSLEASKTFETLPEKTKEFVAAVKGNSHVTDVAINPEEVDTYFQKKKLDPVKVMQQMGVAKEYSKAKESGSDLKIPLEDWTHTFVGSEHFDGLKDDVKLVYADGKVAPSVNEAKAAHDAHLDNQKQMAEMAKNADPESPIVKAANEDAAKLSEKLQPQYEGTNQSPALAKANADQLAEFYRAHAIEFGTSIDDIAKTVPIPRIVGESDTVDPSKAGDVFQQSPHYPKDVAKGKETDQKRKPLLPDVNIIDLAPAPVDVTPTNTVLRKEVGSRLKFQTVTNDHADIKINVGLEGRNKMLGTAFGDIKRNNSEAFQKHLELLPEIPKLLKTALFLTESKEAKPLQKGHEDIANHLFFFAPARVHGENVLVKMQVLEKKDGTYNLYDFRVVAADGASAINTNTSSAAATYSTGHPISSEKTTAFIQRVKPARAKHWFFQENKADTASPEFKNWFGNSKAVDETGKPKVYYHGTDANFESFQANPKGINTYGLGTYLTSDVTAAKRFGENQLQVYVADSNPIDLGDTAFGEKAVNLDSVYKALGIEKIVGAKPLGPKNGAINNYRQLEFSFQKANGLNKAEAPAALRDALVKAGYTSLNSDDIKNVLQPTQIKSVNNRGTFDPNDPRILNQSDENKPLGQASFFPDAQTTLKFFKNQNAATGIHEAAHFYLEARKLLADRPDAPQWLKDDMKTIHEYVGLKDGEKLSTDHHETFADGFTRWQLEGKAPSERMRPVFERFKNWLTALFQRTSQFFGKENLTPEITQVFERMMATHEEIKSAQEEVGQKTVFEDPASFGLSESQGHAIEKATQSAEDELTSHLMQEMKHQQSKEWAAEKDRIKTGLAESFDQKPEQIALAALTKGTYPNGEPLPEELHIKIDRQSIIDEFGKEKLAELPKPYVYAKEGGVPLSEAADLFGFSSGDELLKSISSAENREETLNIQAEAKMKELHGDIMTDGRLNELAIAAVHNYKSGELLQKQLEHLASNDFAKFKGLVKKVARTPPKIEDVRSQAEDQVKRTLYRDVVPNIYKRAETRASNDAVLAFTKGDFEKAFDAKKKQLLAHELYKASSDAREAVDKGVAMMKSFTKVEARKRIGKAGGNYLEQIDSILERFDFSKGVSLSSIDDRKAMVKWAESQRDQGYDIQVPEKLLNEANRQHYKDTSIEDLNDIFDTTKQIAQLAKLKNELLANKKYRDFDEAKASVISSIAAHHEIEKVKKDFAPGSVDRLIKGVKGVAAAHTRMEFLFEAMDGYKPHGPAWESYFLPFADAEDHESVLMREATDGLNKIFDAYPKTERALWFSKKTYIPEVDNSFNKPTLLSFAFNMGNAENIKALQEGFGWSDPQMEAVKKHLDARDWQTAQKVWDHIDTYWPQIEAMEKRLMGIAPEKVAPLAFKNEHGEFKGGYYPLRSDGEISSRASSYELSGDIHDLLGGSYARASTSKGHTIERVGFAGMPVKLDLGVLTEHITNVIHDITHREAVIDAHKLIHDPDLRAAIEGSMGTEMYKQLDPWLRSIAGEKRTDPKHVLESMLNHVRGGATIVNLGWKFTSGLKHTLSYTMATKELGPKYALSGLRDVFDPTNPMKIKEAWDFVTSRSENMKERFSNSDRDIHDAMKKMNIAGIKQGALSVPDFYLEDVKKSYFTFMGHMDLATSLPSWMGAYRKAMDGNMENIKAGDERSAVEYADSLVRQTKGAGEAKDLAAVQRGNDAVKLFTMFYSQLSLRYNNLAKVGGEYRMYKDVPKLIAGLALTWFVPAVLEGLVVGKTIPTDDKKKAAKQIATEELKYPLESVVGVRDLVNGINKKDFQFSPVLDAAYHGVKLTSSLINRVDGEKRALDRNDLNEAVNTAGYFLHLPTRQAIQTGEYMFDWMKGVERPSNPIQGIWQAAVTGHQKK